jgi:Zn-dependent protease
MDVIIKLAALLFSVSVHEAAHGYAAHRLGDPTAKDAGRITLNPLAHIDPFGTIVLPLILVLTHSPVLLGWAKPVPFNPAYFRNPIKASMIVGGAGPASNLLLAAVAGAVFRIFPVGGVVGFFLVQCCVINVILAIFNLIPIPPLDGSRIVMGLLPRHLVPAYLKLERFGFLIIFALLWLGVLNHLIWPIANALLSLLLGA